jgi:methyltransferase OMS1
MAPPNSPSTQTRGKFAPILLSFIAVSLGFYVTQLVIIARQPCQHPEIHQLDQQKDVAARYDETADSFDSEVGTSEALMGINRIRKRLSRQCKGHVLEVSCGTGRNLGYYDLAPGSEIDSITFLDLSAQMVEACKRKWASLYPASSTTAADFKPGLAIRFSTTSAVGPMPPAPQSTTNNSNNNGKYTTIFQTMGLCSTPTPHDLLLNLSSHLDHSNPDSRILLLEHGRSSYAWLNNILDNSAAKHAEIHGCWYNRDMGELVREAAEQSGLEVVESGCWRKHLGTTWVFELRPSGKGAVGEEGVKKVDGAVSSSASASSSEAAAPPAAEGWKGWFGLK